MPRIVCNGYGSAHGVAHGRMWFACSACRWRSSNPVDTRPAEEILASQIKALEFAIANENEPMDPDDHG